MKVNRAACDCPLCRESRERMETAMREVRDAQDATAPNMRLRVLHLPRDQFVIVVDRVPGELLFPPCDEEAFAPMANLSASLIDRLQGCGGAIAFNCEIDMEAWYPYG